MLGVHPKKLQRMLQVYGSNFRNLVQEVRFETGARYLQTSNASLTRIANLVGYSAVSAFSRAFKERFGISPRAWRNQPINFTCIRADSQLEEFTLESRDIYS